MRLIPDQEIKLTADSDVFHTRVYSNTLVNIIEDLNGKKSNTIGLFGGWGSGKSSIVQTLQEDLNCNEKIKTIHYDAWKYSNDAFRRSFLIELEDQLDLEFKENFDSFYQSKTEDIDHNVKIKRFPLWIGVSLLTIALVISLLTFFEILGSSDEKVFYIYSSTSMAILGILTFVLRHLLVVYKVNITSERVFSPEQFEEIFKGAISLTCEVGKGSAKWFKEKLGIEKHIEKIVIIIDNIDRCEPNFAKELLLTIKNFLDVPQCIFVIPVDDIAIKRYLKLKNSDGEEFLRKFFNTTIRIKEHTPQDLFDYTVGKTYYRVAHP